MVHSVSDQPRGTSQRPPAGRVTVVTGKTPAPSSLQPRIDDSGARLPSGAVGIGVYTSETGLFPEAPEKFSQFTRAVNSLDLSVPKGREQLVRAFVDIFGQDEARLRGVSFCAPNGVQYHWP